MISSTSIFEFECWPVGGGYLRVYLFRSRLVNLYFDANENISNITGTGTVWLLPVFPDSIDIKEAFKSNQGGRYFDTTISFTSINVKEVRSFLDLYKHERFVCIAEKPDGSMRLLGSKDLPFSFVFDAADGSKFADKQKIEIRLGGQQLKFAPLYVPD
jgi:hypothetical protein